MGVAGGEEHPRDGVEEDGGVLLVDHRWRGGGLRPEDIQVKKLITDGADNEEVVKFNR